MQDVDTRLSVDDHLAVIRHSGAAFRDHADAAGLDASVPTCPEWTVHDLVAHQGMVHRWAAASLRGERDHDTEVTHSEGMASADILAWFTAGLDGLIATIEATPDDADAMVFLKNAPPPRQFWARRQAHETQVHSIDALAAALGRRPRADEAPINAETAADGLDELLMGFLPRGKSMLRSAVPLVIAVHAVDTGDSWAVRVSDDRTETSRGMTDAADATFRGDAAGLYLGMWNRGDEFTVAGRVEALDLWRSTSRVRWS